MVLPVINYAGLPVSGDPLQEGLQAAILNSIKMRYAPEMAAQSSLGSQLTNRLDEEKLKALILENQYAPQTKEANLQNQITESLLRQVQAEKDRFYLDNPLFTRSGPAGQIGALEYLKKKGSPLADVLDKSIQANLGGQIARTDLANKQASAFNYSKLPMPQKTEMIAQASGMGIMPDEANRRFSQGETVEDIAKGLNIPLDKLPPPIYGATPQTISRVQQRKQIVAELDSIRPFISESLEPYATRFDGYSPKQISDALSGENVDKQARYYAARALEPELARLMASIGTGNVGIELVREIENASFGHLKDFPIQKKAVFKLSQKYISDQLKQAAARANAVGINPRGYREDFGREEMSEEERRKMEGQTHSIKKSSGLPNLSLGGHYGG